MDSEVGYHWFWETFHLRLGYAFERNGLETVTVTYSDGTTQVVDSSASTFGGGMEFNIGFVF